EIVDAIQNDWKSSHGVVSSNFHSICKTLDAHKMIVTWFPSKNEYASVLSSALKMVLQASLNHEEIADYLSGAVASLCERVSICTKLLPIIKTDELKAQLAEVYKKLFVFLWEAAKWFKKSSARRFLNSFNKTIVEERKKAESGINSAIDLIRERSQVEGLRWTNEIKDSSRNVEDRLKELAIKVDECREENRFSQQELVTIGKRMVLLLEQNWKKADFETKEQHDMQFMTTHFLAAVPGNSLLHERQEVQVNQSSRSEVDSYCQKFKKSIFGTDGLALAYEGRLLMADPDIIYRVSNWAARASTEPQVLWIEFPFELQEDSSARMAALGVILTAAQADAPFISYIPGRPNAADIPRSQSMEEAGLLSVVYGLIKQLLRFRPENDSFRIENDTLQQLDGSMRSWRVALNLLNSLLKHTTILRYCIIYGLNDFEGEESEGLCMELIKLLLSHSHRTDSPLSFLFTTSGQSRVMNEVIRREDRAWTGVSMRMLGKRGQNISV
ncbi:uncharacterized protein K452DRAFT_239385, partial [Aplosporella prunicola CBS 121167]